MLALLLRLQRERGMALLLITHDLGVVAEVAQRVPRDVRRADRRVGAGADGVRDAAPPVHRGAAGSAAGAQHRPAPAALDGAASCRAPTTGRAAACCRRAAATCSRAAATERPALFAVPDGCLARCFFPLHTERAVAPSRPCASPGRSHRRRHRVGRGIGIGGDGIRRRVDVIGSARSARARQSTTPSRRGLFMRAEGAAEGARRRVVPARVGAHPRRRRRIGQRQEHLARQVTMIETPTAGARPRRRRASACRCGPEAAIAAQRPDGVPEPVREPQSAQEDRPCARRAARDQHRARRAERGERSRAMLARVGLRPEHHRATRTCSRAASASASRSPAR